MKKILTLFFISSMFWGCSPKIDDISVEDLDITVTTHEEGTDFSSLGTYALADSVYIIAYDDDGNLIEDTFALENVDVIIIDQVRDEMTKLGYTEVDTSANPSVGIYISRVTNSVSGTGFVPGWCGGGWWGYPGYGWCYPGYGYSYEYKTGSLLVDMIDLQSRDDENNSFQVLWHMTSNGYITSDNINAFSEPRVRANVSRGFEQSSYLQTTN